MNFVLQNCRIINEGDVREGDVRVRAGRIAEIGGALAAKNGETATDANGMLLFPGLIDDQVHFREPGLTHKADIASESRAAAAGGITSFMDMPNVLPPTLDMQKIHEKRAIAAAVSRINYAFYLGASTGNTAIIAAADPRAIAGVKIFMGASTGGMLVDDEKILAEIFRAAPTIIATHCESTPRIQKNIAQAQRQFGKNIPAAMHPKIRDAAACYESSSRAAALARQTGARLHILHITTARELALFAPGAPAAKQITCEACAHHLLFDDSDYAALGMRLKTNPAVKTAADKRALRDAAAAGRIDVFATDHAPHLLAEKELPYAEAAAGMPLAEYALPAFLELAADGDLTYPQIAARAAHAPADIFAVKDRGYIREGYWADLVLAKAVNSPARKTPLSKCNWTPFSGKTFRHAVRAVFVNGEKVWDGNAVNDSIRGMPLEFNRPPRG
ncbi:MAG: dihydroorotase [Betaproteobacteria bacterium]|nr:dihydroorotase [Betaproteobacteria bacterium]